MNVATRFFFLFISGNILFFIFAIEKVQASDKLKEKILEIKENTSEVSLDAEIDMYMKGQKDVKSIELSRLNKYEFLPVIKNAEVEFQRQSNNCKYSSIFFTISSNNEEKIKI